MPRCEGPAQPAAQPGLNSQPAVGRADLLPQPPSFDWQEGRTGCHHTPSSGPTTRTPGDTASQAGSCWGAEGTPAPAAQPGLRPCWRPAGRATCAAPSFQARGRAGGHRTPQQRAHSQTPRQPASPQASNTLPGTACMPDTATHQFGSRPTFPHRAASQGCLTAPATCSSNQQARAGQAAAAGQRRQGTREQGGAPGRSWSQDDSR